MTKIERWRERKEMNKLLERLMMRIIDDWWLMNQTDADADADDDDDDEDDNDEENNDKDDDGHLQFLDYGDRS